MSRKLQSPAIPRSNKSGKEGKRLAWLGGELQVKLKKKNKCTGSGNNDR